MALRPFCIHHSLIYNLDLALGSPLDKTETPKASSHSSNPWFSQDLFLFQYQYKCRFRYEIWERKRKNAQTECSLTQRLLKSTIELT